MKKIIKNSSEVKVRFRFLILLFVALCCAHNAWGENEYSEEVEQKIQMIQDLETNWSERLQEYLETVSPLTIQGQVIDQNNEPVSGADIDIHWEYFDEQEFYQTHIGSQTITTNAEGFFTFTKENVLKLTMWEVERKGYEFKKDLSPYYQSNSDKEAMQKNSVNEPIIVYMRKLNPTTFLLKSGVSYYFKESSTTIHYNMIPGLMYKIDPDLSKMKKPEQGDIIFTVDRNEDGSYTMHIQPVPKIGGSMQVLDEYLYEAPAEGYQPEVSFTIRPEDGEIIRYLYFTSRKTPVYSRMSMELKADSSDNELEFRCSTWTNPYGKRNLEWEPEMPNKLRHILRKEAEKALNKGTLPPEPENLQALIDQYNSN